MKRIGITRKLAPRIRHTGAAQRLIAPEVVASALEGEPVGSLAERLNPVSLGALRHEIGRRLTSTGGRPSLEDQDWTRLCALASAHRLRRGTAARRAFLYIRKTYTRR